MVFLAVRLSHYRNLLVILVLLLLAAALVVRLVLASDLLTYRLVDSPLWLYWEAAAVIKGFALGLLLGFGGMVFNHTLLPLSTSPTARKEVVEQRRELV